MLQLMVLDRVEPEQNVHRHYVLSIEPSLFGEIGLRREWERLGNRGGASRLDLYPDAAGAREALGRRLRRKARRRYEVRETQRGPATASFKTSHGIRAYRA